MTLWSLAAILAGFLLGEIGRATHASAIAGLSTLLQPVADVWLAALQMLVLPLVVANVLAAITGAREERSIGALGARAVALFLVMLAVGGVFAWAVTGPIVHRMTIDTTTVDAFRASASAVKPPAIVPASRTFTDLLPHNLIDAAAHGDILPVLLVAVLFGAAVRRLPEDSRTLMAKLFRAAADAALQCIRWVLWVTPFGVLALTLHSTLAIGSGAAGLLGVYLAIVCGLLVAGTLVLYPATAIAGRVSMARFARAVAPAQLIAASTQSSLAALPALVEGGREALDLPASATGFVLPLSVSVFKVNRTISAVVKVVFLTHLYGLPFGVPEFSRFLATTMIISFGTAGVAGGGGFSTLPAYLAAGVPVEGAVIFEATNMATEIFKTVMNVTGDMSVAVLLSRARRAVVPAASPAVVAARTLGGA